MMMGSRWRVDDLGNDIWLVRRSPWSGAADLPRGAEPLVAEVAIARLGAWFPEGRGGDEGRLAEICLSLEGEFPGSGTPELGWLKRSVRQALRDGRLVAVRIALPAPAGAAHDEVEEQAAPRPAPRDEKTWIEIALVDDGDPPEPVPFKRYRIELPDGSVRQGMLDANGRAAIVGIDPGTCQVTFPDFDDREWRRR